MCLRDVGLDRSTHSLCKPSQVLVNMETAQNHSNVTEPFPHPWHGAKLSHRGSHASSSVSLEPAPHCSSPGTLAHRHFQSHNMTTGKRFDQTPGRACEMCSQNTNPVPLQSCVISAVCAHCPGGTIKAYNGFVTCWPERAVGMRSHHVRTSFCLGAQDLRKSSVPGSVQSQGRPNFGGAGKEGRVTGSECHPTAW